MTSRTEQSGIALVYTLLFIALMTMASLSAVQFSKVEQRISTNYRDQQAALISAEIALLEAERCVQEQSSCNNIANFSSDCNGGLCFSGLNRNDVSSCNAGNASPWLDASLWPDNNRTVSVVSLNNLEATARYIIEFICYLPNTAFGITPDPGNPSHWSRFYRITVLATINRINSQAMIQSTYQL